jgi:zinc transporter ZupT
LGLVPLVTAVGLHSLLDGWNIGIALSFPDQHLVWTFLGGIALHKLSSGFAIGAVFRANTPTNGRCGCWR